MMSAIAIQPIMAIAFSVCNAKALSPSVSTNASASFRLMPFVKILHAGGEVSRTTCVIGKGRKTLKGKVAIVTARSLPPILISGKHF